MVDLNPLHYINKFNHMAGDNMASMMEFLGISDPAVDPDGVREIAKKWRSLAKAVDASVKDAEAALRDVTWEGKTATAFNKRAKKTRSQATKMADSLRDGADALDKYADEAHELLTELNVIIVEIIEVEMAGLALSVLTGGASAVVGSLAAGARFAKAMALIGRIEHAGSAMARTIRAVLEVIRGLRRALKALKEIKTIARVGKMAGEGAKFAALDTLLKDPSTFKDPGKLAETLALGAALGVGLGSLGTLLGKGLGKLKPKDLSKLRGAMKLNCASFERLSLRPGFDKLPASVRNALKKFVRDPIDVATGDMVLPRTDVRLPGVLPLVLERTHLSSYRFGGWFGPSWASTLDQRVQADEDGFVYAAADGARLCFPVPDAETGEAAPETPGSRLTLSWADGFDGAICVTDPDSGLVQVFHSPVPAAVGEAVDVPLQYVQDRNGNRITIEYDEGDIPAAVTHSGGYRIALDRDETDSRITGLRLLDPADPSAPGTTLLTFGYDESGHLTEETNSSGVPMRYTYDPEGRITSWTDRNGTTYWYEYDSRGRVTATGGTGNALASTLTYEDATHTTHVTDSLGHVRVYEHNDAFRLIRETDPLGNVTEQEWDGELRLTAVTDALGHTTRCRYDEHGRVALVTRPNGRETTATYNELGLPTRVSDGENSEWRREYDERGNLTGVTAPDGTVSRYAYNTSGHLTKVTDALGHTTRVHSDAAGLPDRVTDPLGAVTRFERDAFGRPLTLTDPLGSVTRMEWTVEGNLALRVMPDGSAESWTYDSEGNCTTHTDAVGAVTRYEYTHFDLLAARTEPDGVRHTFTHDSELRLTRVTNPQGLHWKYAYDPAGRPLSETDFDGRTLNYRHDAAGRLVARTNALGLTTHFALDELGQVVRQTAGDVVTSYTYDPAGRLTRAVAPQARVEFRYDTGGRLLAESVNGRTTSYRYDVLGRRVSRTTPSGATSGYDYDAVGNLTALHSGGRTVDFEYDLAGQEALRRIGNVIKVAHTFDALGRLTVQSVTGAGGRSIRRRAYDYRADGNLVGLDDDVEGTRRFDLDRAGRVTAVRAEDWSECYVYDAAGNQTDASWPGLYPGADATGARTYEGTRITRAGTVRYEHDALGRIVLRQKIRLSRKPATWRYTWDAEDRLTAVRTPDGTLWRYLYDPLGRRIAKQRMAANDVSVAEQTDFTWDGTTLCEQTTTAHTAPGSTTLTWDYQDLHPVAQRERAVAGKTVHGSSDEVSQGEIDARFFAIVTDLVGSPTELLDEDGAVTWRARSTLWGSTVWAENSTAYTPLRFPGQYHDSETALNYNYFRYYDAETARYLSPDPLGLVPAPNPHTYVHNPHTWTDPLGLAPECRELGLRDDAQNAIAKLENIKKDPIGSINSQPNHNHYSAARREARSEVVARKPDGTPFDHISDLKQARNGLEGIRRILTKELQKPPETITPRGREVLSRKRKETIVELERLNRFLNSIGHG
ncbi:polymorphic toxin type 28 domain-containing protein [Streptomyces sp. NPDC029674]|uniref:polymorphic toxin type 28 domain-containing protein n=1 Tax=Streptomyces sp. NPDC029674 TaxID=3365297 RepID=UPI00385144EA